MGKLSFPGYDVERAQRYGRSRRLAAMGQMATSLARDGAFIATGHAERLRRRIGEQIRQPELADAAHLQVLTAEGWLIGLPERFLLGQTLERQYGMTKRSNAAWLRAELTALGVQSALTVPAAVGAFSVIRRFPDRWHIILPGVAVPMQLILVRLAPVLLFPRFNSFTPIADQDLTKRINNLADRAGIELGGVFVADMSRQSERANAFFAGMGSTKRVVLGDTLLRGFKADEIDGVVAHEIGHQVHHDLWRSSLLNAAAGFAGAFALKWIMPKAASISSRWTGTTDISTSASLPLWSLMSSLSAVLVSPLFLAYSRKVERRTDVFAVTLTGDGNAYARGMERLLRQNLDDPYPPMWATLLFRSHPPTGERIESAIERAAGGRR